MTPLGARGFEGNTADRRGFLFDLERCTGCNACELACTIENELAWGKSWRAVTTFNPDRLPGIPTFHLSLACNHCESAPCMRHCPALAIGRDARTSNVEIDAARCIGCKYCSWACPYGAPLFDTQTRVMTKCTGCNHRVAAGLEPACVALCPTTALGYGVLAGAESVPGFPKTPARPAIRFQPLREGRSAPESTWNLPAELLGMPPAGATRTPEITLRAEWPLVVFTTVLPMLVGWTLATVPGGVVPDFQGVVVPSVPGAASATYGVLFLLGTVFALGTSLLHLGHKSRAWRAVLNVRGSWLSREVAGSGGFVLVAALSVLGLGPTWMPGLVAGLGIVTLFAVDRAYDLVRPRPGLRLHSADACATGLLYAAVLRAWVPGVLTFTLVKLVLYAVQGGFWRRVSSRQGDPVHPWRDRDTANLESRGLVLGVLRLLGLGAACAISFVTGPVLLGLFLLMLIGEIVDRVQFYLQLEIVSPRRQVVRELIGGAVARQPSQSTF